MRVIITVIGKDRPGIIATVSGSLYRMNANILDITQTVLQDEFFTMIMVVDTAGVKAGFGEFRAEMAACAEELGMEIEVQREEIFQSMHRI